MTLRSDEKMKPRGTVVRLEAFGPKLMSRSQAKRIVRNLEESQDVVLDFKGVDLVGQGFADEVFRVWAHAHPDRNLIPIEMKGPVEFMVERAIRRAEED